MGGNDNEWHDDISRSLVDFLDHSILYTTLHVKRVILAGVFLSNLSARATKSRKIHRFAISNDTRTHPPIPT